MDYGTLFWIVAIVLWEIIEYRNRERIHREKLAYLRIHHELPSTLKKPQVLNLRMTGGMILLLLGSIVAVGVMALRGDTRHSGVYLIIIVPFLILLVALTISFLKNLNARKLSGRE